MRSWTAPNLPTISPSTHTSVRLYDSSSRKLLESPQDPQSRSLGLYVCGITPYDATHIGHAATYIAFDILNRLWRDLGYSVKYVQNVTDIDDPLLERAANTQRDWVELAAEQTELFREDMAQLRVIPPADYLGAVETIPLVVDAVEQLITQGFAYRVVVPEDERGEGSSAQGDVYFDVTKSPSFGDVSGFDEGTMLDLFAGRGGDPNRVGKRNALDPLLWRAARRGEPSWPGASLGRGRPGWHIECAVIAERHLSMPFEVQAGGSDLIFPHHEMSAIHGEALVGVASFAQRFMHAGMVGYDGEKMSKSKGNLVFVSALRNSGVDPMAIRLAILTHHYRSDWEWTPAELSEAEIRLRRWRGAFGSESNRLQQEASKVIADIRAALADDLDAPRAVQVVDDWVADSDGPTSRARADGEAAISDVKNAVDALLGII